VTNWLAQYATWDAAAWLALIAVGPALEVTGLVDKHTSTFTARAAAEALGTGRTPDASGTLELAKVSIVSAGAPTNAATAGTQGDIIQYGGYIYLCVVTGYAGAATWAKLTAVNLLA